MPQSEAGIGEVTNNVFHCTLLIKAKFASSSANFRRMSYSPTNHKLRCEADCLGLYGQVKKRIRWMPWQSEAMKDVVACDKLRGVGKQTLIRRSLNGGTHLG